MFLTYAATENVLAEADGLVGGIVGMNNFYLYQFQGTTFYQLIPWDKDMTFSVPNRDLMLGFTIAPDINILAARLVAIPEYLNFYLEQVSIASAMLGASGGWADNLITTEYNLINNAASDDPNKQCLAGGGILYSCGAVDFQSNVEYLHAFLEFRQPFAAGEVLSYGYQPITGDPQIAGLNVIGQGASPNAAPGALVALSGANLGVSGQTSTEPLPRALAGTFVAVEGVRAPLMLTTSGQLELQIPGDLPPGTAYVIASVSGEMSNIYTATVDVAVPAILAVTHGATGAAVSAADPLMPGEVLVTYANGLGAVSGNLAIGTPAPQGTLYTTISPPAVTLGGIAVDVAFSGLTPGYVGLYQLNTTVPLTLPQGTSTILTLVAGGHLAIATVAISNP